MPSFDWISFKLDLRRITWQTWVQLGECAARCVYMKTVPIKPSVRDQLHRVYLAKGAHATTAIEGNTLTEEQVKALVDKHLELPTSKEYLEREVQNIIDACNKLGADIPGGRFGKITRESILDFNRQVLANGIPHAEGAVPGEFRSHVVVVGNIYRAPDAQLVGDMMKRFCDWMNSQDFQSAAMPIHFAILKAITAHLYMAWIHPFGDGNGRVARLLEFAILLSSGIPSPAAHLLSNHYNSTREEYYAQLDRASKTSDPSGFFDYAIRGLRDGLEEQFKYIQGQVVDVCWRDYVYEQFREARPGAVTKRRRDLVLRVSDAPMDKQAIIMLMSSDYSGKTTRTLMRDLNTAEEMGLLACEQGKYRARKEVMSQFLPFAHVAHGE